MSSARPKTSLRAERVWRCRPRISTSVLADPAQDRFRRVQTTGVWAHEKEIHVYGRSQRGNEGFYILTPLLRDGKPARDRQSRLGR